MKFIKVTTKSTREDIDKITSRFNDYYEKLMLQLYNSFEALEITTEEGFIGMYAIVDEKTLQKLFTEYARWNIEFSYKDISESILFGHFPPGIDEVEKKHIDILANKFVEDNIDVDTILDKISKNGYNSLTEVDFKVLQTHQ